MHTLLVFRDGKVHRPSDKSSHNPIGCNDVTFRTTSTLTLSRRSSTVLMHSTSDTVVPTGSSARHRRQSSGESSSDISICSDASSVVTVDSQDSNPPQQRFWTVPRVSGANGQDMGYRFHLRELESASPPNDNELMGSNSLPGLIKYAGKFTAVNAICGETGTVRGVKNRVRAGIDAFQRDKKNRFEKVEEGRVIVYTTSMGVVRGTFQQCLKVKTTLRTLLVAFEERDIFMCKAYQKELADRMTIDEVAVPQVFVDGNLLGDWDAIEKLNESGILRKILRPYKSGNANNPCQKCGGYRLLVCANCNGSKKSIHRNHFTNSVLPLRCMNCDENGLAPCDLCVR